MGEARDTYWPGSEIDYRYARPSFSLIENFSREAG